MGYEPLTAAMDALASCTPQYNGEQAQAVAKLLSQWHAKWTQESELHGKAIDRIAALERELAEAREKGERLLRKACEELLEAEQERDRLREDGARLDFLEGEMDRESQGERRYVSLFRRNDPITREAIDSCIEIESWSKK